MRPGDDLQQPSLQFSYHDQAQPFRIEARQRIQGSQYAVTGRYYDALDRLVSVSSGEMQASFVYDGDGQRVAGLIDGAATVWRSSSGM